MHALLLLGLGFFAGGIALRSVVDLSVFFVFLLVLVSLSIGLLAYAFQRRAWVVVVLMLLAFSGGLVRMHLAVPAEVLVFDNKQTVFVGEVIQQPDERDTYVQLVVATDALPHNVLVRAPLYSAVSYKDRVKVEGIIEEVVNFSGEDGRVFNYRGYLAKSDIRYITNFPEVEVTQTRNTLPGYLLQTKNAYLTTLKRLLPEPSAALAGGITVGERRSLGEELTENFRVTGTYSYRRALRLQHCDCYFIRKRSFSVFTQESGERW